jgi:hypothetical protein
MYTTKNLENYFNSKDKGNMSTKNDGESNYKNIKQNVDNLKVIQVGITLANEQGEYPEDVSTWQFNFKFDLEYVSPLTLAVIPI